MSTYIFPGQGSQSVGMGAEVFDHFDEHVRNADELLGYSIKTLCLSDPKNQLSITSYTQPALYIVNALSYLKRVQEVGNEANFFIGHSLGEYNALFAAGVFDFLTGLTLVKKRGELMAQAKEGGMAAIIGLTEAQITETIDGSRFRNIYIANYNSPQQIVISGARDEVVAGQEMFENAGAKMYIPLNVSGAFHSVFMEEARQEFKEFLTGFNFSPLNKPVIANLNAKPYIYSEIKNNLADQITHPVRWTQSVNYLMKQNEQNFIEVGPGRVLTGLIKRIQRGQ